MSAHHHRVGETCSKCANEKRERVARVESELTFLAGVRAGLEAAKVGVLGGRFLHDDAPAAKFAREVAAMIDRIDAEAIAKEAEK